MAVDIEWSDLYRDVLRDWRTADISDGSRLLDEIGISFVCAATHTRFDTIEIDQCIPTLRPLGWRRYVLYDGECQLSLRCIANSEGSRHSRRWRMSFNGSTEQKEEKAFIIEKRGRFLHLPENRAHHHCECVYFKTHRRISGHMVKGEARGLCALYASTPVVASQTQSEAESHFPNVKESRSLFPRLLSSYTINSIHVLKHVGP